MENGMASSTTHDSSYDLLSNSHLNPERSNRKNGKFAGVRILYSGEVTIKSFLVFSRQR